MTFYFVFTLHNTISVLYLIFSNKQNTIVLFSLRHFEKYSADCRWNAFKFNKPKSNGPASQPKTYNNLSHHLIQVSRSMLL